MSFIAESKLYENDGRVGTSAHIPGEILSESLCPLGQGDEIYAQIVPQTAIVLFPREVILDYPVDLTLQDPASIEDRLATEFSSQLCQDQD